MSSSNSFLCDFGINSAENLSNAIAIASEANLKHNHSVPEQVNSDSIGLSISIGAIFLFTASAFGINWKWLKQQKAEVSAFEVFNETLMVLSAGVIFYTSNAAFKKLFGK